jgi:hypothetical protein
MRIRERREEEIRRPINLPLNQAGQTREEEEGDNG